MRCKWSTPNAQVPSGQHETNRNPGRQLCPRREAYRRNQMTAGATACRLSASQPRSTPKYCHPSAGRGGPAFHRNVYPGYPISRAATSAKIRCVHIARMDYGRWQQSSVDVLFQIRQKFSRHVEQPSPFEGKSLRGDCRGSPGV